MTLSKRVRDCRYAKGWGPDELASRAEISRTALYQIECGKTETPRASTVRRIARALEIPIDLLIAEEMDAAFRNTASCESGQPAGDATSDEVESVVHTHSSLEALDILSHDPMVRFRPDRQRELSRMFFELLASPLG